MIAMHRAQIAIEETRFGIDDGAKGAAVRRQVGKRGSVVTRRIHAGKDHEGEPFPILNPVFVPRSSTEY
jgi:hypothetical protein